MEERFEVFLNDEGKKPSVVKAYVRAVERVLEERHISWNYLEANIDTYVEEYEVGGIHEAEGARSHRTCICALKAFQRMLLSDVLLSDYDDH